jgi:hypothetical protein
MPGDELDSCKCVAFYRRVTEDTEMGLNQGEDRFVIPGEDPESRIRSKADLTGIKPSTLFQDPVFKAWSSANLPFSCFN